MFLLLSLIFIGCLFFQTALVIYVIISHSSLTYLCHTCNFTSPKKRKIWLVIFWHHLPLSHSCFEMEQDNWNLNILMIGPPYILYSYFHAPISSVWTLGSWGSCKYECEMSAKQFELDGTIRGLTWRSELAFLPFLPIVKIFFAGKICRIINVSAVHCPFVLKFDNAHALWDL